MRPLLLLLALLLGAAPAAAQEPEWRSAEEHHVLLSAFDYEPEVIALPAGRPVKLVLVNNSRTSLSFAAPAFFRSARLRSGDAEAVRDGSLRLAPGQTRTIALVPAAGRYRARSGNIFHRLLGMSARIVVE